MRWAEIERLLVLRLAEPLPGHAAQARLAPRPRSGWRAGAVPEDCRVSVVLLLLYPVAESAHLVLTLRPAGLTRHAGQVSLPGGVVEEGEAFDAAALREAQEEIGVDPEGVVVLGGLSPLHVPVSGFVLHPRVALLRSRPAWVADPVEVERVLEVPVADLLDPARLGLEWREAGGREIEVPFFLLGGERVWGATAMVLAEFVALLGHVPDPWAQRRP